MKALAIPFLLIALAEIFMGKDGLSDTLAPPSLVLKAMVESLKDGSFFLNLVQTFASLTGGLVIGTTLGLFLGILIGFSKRADSFSFLVVESLRPIPSVALLPLSLLIFGFGFKMEIFVVAFACFFPFLILTQNAVKQIEPRQLEVAKLIGLSPQKTLFSIIIPSCAPRLLSAFRFAVGICLIVAVTCEVAANPQGLGHALMLAQETLRPATMLAFLVWVGLIGFSLNLALLALEKRLFAHRSDYDEKLST